MIEPPEMHQLVDQDVLAHGVGHQDETPVETDVTGWRARSPARSLVPYADARHVQAEMPGEAQKLGGQVARGLPAQFLNRFRGIGEAPRAAFLHLCPLPLNPGALLL